MALLMGWVAHLFVGSQSPLKMFGLKYQRPRRCFRIPTKIYLKEQLKLKHRWVVPFFLMFTTRENTNTMNLFIASMKKNLLLHDL